MQDISVSLTAVVFLALMALVVAAVAAPVEIVGTLQSVRAVPLSGKIMVIQETPHMNLTTYGVEEDSRFRFARDSEGPLWSDGGGRDPGRPGCFSSPRSDDAAANLSIAKKRH